MKAMFSKHRLEVLSDGVFAIVMTLLILDIKAPVDVGPAELGAALLRDSHQWISFSVTFWLAAVFWTMQHKVFDELTEIDTTGLTLTFVFLAFVSVLPFTTSLWGHHLQAPLAFDLYFANQFCLGLALTAALESARISNRIRTGVQARVLRLRLVALNLAMGTGLLSAWVVGRWSLPVAWVMPLPLAVSLIGRILRARSERHWKHADTATQPTAAECPSHLPSEM